jgi:predicted RNase H-like HicB family nuclease
MKYTAVFEPADEGGYVCWLEEIPSIQSQGEDLDDARENLRDAYQLSMEYLREKAKEDCSKGRVSEVLELAVG